MKELELTLNKTCGVTIDEHPFLYTIYRIKHDCYRCRLFDLYNQANNFMHQTFSCKIVTRDDIRHFIDTHTIKPLSERDTFSLVIDLDTIYKLDTDDNYMAKSIMIHNVFKHVIKYLPRDDIQTDTWFTDDNDSGKQVL